MSKLKFPRYQLVECFGKNSHGVDVTGEIMMVKDCDEDSLLLSLLWFGHKKDCHMPASKCRQISKDRVYVIPEYIRRIDRFHVDAPCNLIESLQIRHIVAKEVESFQKENFGEKHQNFGDRLKYLEQSYANGFGQISSYYQEMILLRQEIEILKGNR